MVQWLKIRLTKQETQAQTLVGKLDPSCFEATKPAPQLLNLSAATRESMHPNKRSCVMQVRPDAAKSINIKKKKEWVNYRQGVLIRE